MIDTIFYFPSSMQEYEGNKNNINPRTISFIPPGENEDFGIICKNNVQYGSHSEKMVDEEDITEENNVIKFKDRSSSDGMGYVILRKNKTFKEQVEGQDKINTIFEIRYNFNLNGDEIVIPSNCILKFTGGSISNGTLTGNNTQIIASKVSIFTDIVIAGTWNVPYITSAWFSDAQTVDDTLKQVFNLTSSDVYNEVIIDEGDYYVECLTGDSWALKVNSNTKIILLGNIRLKTSSFDKARLLAIYNCSNVSVEGSGCLYGDKLTHIYYDGNSYPDGYIPGFIARYGHDPVITPEKPQGYSSADSCHGIYTYNATNISIKGISIYNCTGDGIFIGSKSGYITVKNVAINNTRRQGISIVGGYNIFIENVSIKDVKGTAPESGIDVEPSSDSQHSDYIIFKNLDIQGVSCGITATGSYDNYDKILIQNVHVKDAIRGLSVHRNAKKVLVENSSFDVTVRGSKVYPERLLQGNALSQVHLRDCYINVNVPYIKPGFDPSDESMVKNYSDYLTYNIEETEETEEELKDLYTAIGLEDINGLIDSCHITSNVGSINGSGARLSIKNNWIVGGSINFNSGESIRILGNRLDIDGKISGFRMFIVGNDIGACKRIEGSNVSFIGNYIYFKNSNESSMFYTDIYSRIIGNRINVDSTVINKVLVENTNTLISNNHVNGAEYIIKTDNTTGNAYNNFGPSTYYPDQYAIRREGSTRPTTPQTGFQFFDTTIGKPIYWNGAAWVDANDTPVDYRYHNTVTDYNIGKKIHTREDIGTTIDYQNPTSETLMDCNVLDVHAGDLIKIVGVGAFYGTSYALVDNDGKLLKRSASITATSVYDYPPKLYVNVEVDCKLILNFRNASVESDPTSQDYVKVPYGNHREIPYEVIVYSNSVPSEEPADNTEEE